ncbi:MAG TPA: VOC family protein [Pyrinomonadaceae bacterium]|nr:VOC family protein [Pyrinomonadaceae bacterium]
MQLSPMLSFNGQCEAAFKFYEQYLGGKMQTLMTWGDSPMADQVPSEWRDRIIHASLIVGETSLLGGDAPPDRYEEPRGFSVAIQIDDPAEAERIFKALAENGTVQMPMQQTFWSVSFGMCVDRFGIPWIVNCEQAP